MHIENEEKISHIKNFENKNHIFISFVLSMNVIQEVYPKSAKQNLE